MAKDTFFQKKATLNAGGRLIDLSSPKVMGIINLTPDSFFAGSRKQGVEEALQQAGKMLDEGAAFLDLGAYSSRPGAEDISVQEETDRLLPVVEAIAIRVPEAVLSIDTFRSKVAEAAINAGAHIINDISGGQLDDAMFATVARLQVPYILMHMKGSPQTMLKEAHYEDVFTVVLPVFIIAQMKLNYKITTIDTDLKTVSFKMFILPITRTYYLDYFDGYINTTVKDKYGDYKCFYLVKDGKLMYKMSGRFYSNINELHEGLTPLKDLGFIKSTVSLSIKIAFGSQVLTA